MLGIFSSLRTATRATVEDVTLTLVGDSTLRGSETDGPFRTSSLLQAFLGAVLVTNEAYGGKTLRDLMSGSSPFPGVWPTGIDGQIVVLGFGANEAAHDDSLLQFEADVRAVAADDRVILRTPLPMDTSVFDPEVNNKETLDYAEVVRDVAADLGNPLIDAYAYTIALPNWQSLLRDRLHPTDAFYAKLAVELYAPVIAARARELRA